MKVGKCQQKEGAEEGGGKKVWKVATQDTFSLKRQEKAKANVTEQSKETNLSWHWVSAQ